MFADEGTKEAQEPKPPEAPAAAPAPAAPDMPADINNDIRSALAWWNDQCRRDDATGQWIAPVTQDMLEGVGWMDWANMLKDEDLKIGRRHMTKIMPVFFMDEADHNNFDRPRLDFVVSFDDGRAVRYHPACEEIWLDAAGLPEGSLDAITQRRQRLQKLRKKQQKKHRRDRAKVA
jgi:hypothetical protein